MKRQVVIIVSIALVSFLVGTLFSMGSTASGILPNPFENRVNDISELQAKIDSLNSTLTELQKKTQIKIIRFTEPDEINITNTGRNWYNTTTFVWKPNNSESNSILSIYCYFEFCCRNWTQPFTMTLWTDICVNGFDSTYSKTQTISKPSGETYDWKQVCFQVNEGTTPNQEPELNPSWIRPNQETYTITLRTLAYCVTFYVPTYVRNINVILTVVDGNP